jgi:hypothetical protein
MDVGPSVNAVWVLFCLRSGLVWVFFSVRCGALPVRCGIPFCSLGHSFLFAAGLLLVHWCILFRLLRHSFPFAGFTHSIFPVKKDVGTSMELEIEIQQHTYVGKHFRQKKYP